MISQVKNFVNNFQILAPRDNMSKQESLGIKNFAKGKIFGAALPLKSELILKTNMSLRGVKRRSNLGNDKQNLQGEARLLAVAVPTHRHSQERPHRYISNRARPLSCLTPMKNTHDGRMPSRLDVPSKKRNFPPPKFRFLEGNKIPLFQYLNFQAKISAFCVPAYFVL